jgi:hypothetical protein
MLSYEVQPERTREGTEDEYLSIKLCDDKRRLHVNLPRVKLLLGCNLVQMLHWRTPPRMQF